MVVSVWFINTKITHDDLDLVSLWSKKALFLRGHMSVYASDYIIHLPQYFFFTLAD